MGNDQKPRCSSCIAIEPHNFKILPFFLYDYHTSQLKNIAISLLLLSLLTGINWVSNPTQFFLEKDRNSASIIITIISNIIVLVSHVICFEYLMSISHCVNKKVPPSHNMYLGLNPPSKTLAPLFYQAPS